MAVARLRHAAAALGRTVRDRIPVARRTPPLHVLVEQAARIGYGARGFAYLPLGIFVVLAGLHTRSGEVTNTAAALETLESQPGGSWILGLTAVGLMAFGAFAFVEARWRRIRPPRDLKLG